MKFVSPLHGTPGPTIKMTASDVVQSIPSTNFSLDGKVVLSALITCETFSIRFTCGTTDPSQGNALGHLLYDGQSLKISNGAAVRNFKFVNADNGSNAVLQITFEYAIGA